MHRLPGAIVVLIGTMLLMAPSIADSSTLILPAADGTQRIESASPCVSPSASPSTSSASEATPALSGVAPLSDSDETVLCSSPTPTPSTPVPPGSEAPPPSSQAPSVDPSTSEAGPPTSPSPTPSAVAGSPSASPPPQSASPAPTVVPRSTLPPPLPIFGPGADPPGPGITEPHHDTSPAEPRHPWTSDRRWGVYGTSLLVDAAQRVAREHAAFSQQQLMRRVFSPFPVGGLAWWSDTWGAPRYAGGYHPHHGQDILCNAGTPLLAVSRGTVRLSNDPLGGTTLKLVRPDGSYWYYAHLDRYAKGVDDGSIVRDGTILGMCGSSGDATVPHLHFCRFSASGRPEDPMQALVRWLHQAEHRVGTERSGPGRSPVDTRVAEETDLARRRQRHVDLGIRIEAAPAQSAQASGDPTLPIDAALLLFLLAGLPLRRRFHRGRARG